MRISKSIKIILCLLFVYTNLLAENKNPKVDLMLVSMYDYYCNPKEKTNALGMYEVALYSDAIINYGVDISREEPIVSTLIRFNKIKDRLFFICWNRFV